MTESEKRWRKSLEVAERRFMAIAPALESGLCRSEHRQVIQGIVARTNLSERTVYRLLEKYRKGQFEALRPFIRSAQDVVCSAIEPHILEYALTLKIELPFRSVPQIMATMKSHGIITDNQVAVSTLRRYISHMKHVWKVLPKVQGAGSRSFRMNECNHMWQSDIKEAREIRVVVDSKTRRTKHVYMVAFIDDKSRLLCHGQWYVRQKTAEVLDCFRQAIEKYGLPRNVYTDNGSQYISDRFGSVCAQLGVRQRRATPGNAAAKGKIERLNRTVEEFIQEMRLEKPKTLIELNKYFRTWMDEYNNRKHSAHKDLNLSPLAAFNLDKTPGRKLDYATLRDKFKAIEWRKVLKNGCVKISGHEYDVGNECIGKRLQFRYEEPDTQMIELWQDELYVKTIYPVVIGEKNRNYHKSQNSNRKSETPVKSPLVTQGWEKNRTERLKDRYGGLSFSDMATKGGDNDAV